MERERHRGREREDKLWVCLLLVCPFLVSALPCIAGSGGHFQCSLNSLKYERASRSIAKTCFFFKQTAAEGHQKSENKPPRFRTGSGTLKMEPGGRPEESKMESKGRLWGSLGLSWGSLGALLADFLTNYAEKSGFGSIIVKLCRK